MRVPVDPDAATSAGGVEQFEYVELDTGEVGRLVMPTDAECQYVHELKAPIVENGVVLKEEKKRKDGTKYEVYATSFVGRRLCMGDPDYIAAHGGLDPQACLACAAARDGITDLIPERRYAVPVIRIATKSKSSTDPLDPPSARILILRLTWRQYEQLIKNLKGIRELYGWGPEHPVRAINADVIIECTDAQWRRYEFRPPMRPAWTQAKNPALNEYIKQLWGNTDNRPTEDQLRIACGRMGDLVWMKEDVGQVVEAWADVKAVEQAARTGQRPPGRAETAQPGGGTDDLTAGMEDLDAILGEPGQASDASSDADELAGLGEFAPKAEPTAPKAANGSAKPSQAASAPAGELEEPQDTAGGGEETVDDLASLMDDL